MTYFVSRHPGAQAWAARRQLRVDRFVPALDPATVLRGDRVLGTLPVHLAAEVCARGGRYFHLSLDLPLDARGGELDADRMDAYAARLEEYRVTRLGSGE